MTLEVDDAPRTVEVPEALAAAFTAHPAAAEGWAALSYSKQRQHAQSIGDAKTEETRDRRLQKVRAGCTWLIEPPLPARGR